jgi:hypothetical protein
MATSAIGEQQTRSTESGKTVGDWGRIFFLLFSFDMCMQRQEQKMKLQADSRN